MRKLVLAAHGSTHPGYAAVFDWIAARIVGNRPDQDVAVGYLDHCEPRLADLPTAGAVVVPMLLATGHHLTVDIPAMAPDAIIAAPIGPDPHLAEVLARRLDEAGRVPGSAVTLAAAGSSHDAGLEDVQTAADQLSALLGVQVTTAYVGSGEPRLSDVAPQVVATYLLAPGHFADLVAACGAPVISAPLGMDPRIAEAAMRRYDAALPLL